MKKKKDIILSHNCILLKISLHNFLNTFSPCKHAGFILEHSLAGFPQFGKKCLQKFTSPHQMGHKNYRPKDKYFFFWKKITDTVTSLIWRPLYKLTLNFYSLLPSQLPFFFFVWVIISQDKHLGFCSHLNPGFFSCPECSKMDAKH